MVRKSVVAGQFYPGSKDKLLSQIGSLVGPTDKKTDAIGVVSPHAGYAYSGKVAAGVFESVNTKSTYVILGPNHTGMGAEFGIDPNDSWDTPLGEIEIDKKLSDRIIKNSTLVKYDSLSHAREHSVEVQLPFIRFFRKNFKFVPIVISYADPGTYAEIGNSIARAVKALKIEKDVLMVASSDMTHYESQKSAKAKDKKAIEAVLALDERLLIERVSAMGISMCGYAPAAIMISAVRQLGAKSARLISYQTSGDVTGDYSSVVGYAGIVIS